MQTDKDIVIIGAGFAGMYAVHKLRDELKLDVQAFDAGGGFGGTWWWNCYPGARVDFESVHYSYSFSDEIQKEWKWSERFASQPELLAYLEFVAKRLDLHRSFQFNTRVTSVVWNDAGRLWTVGTNDGKSITARYVVTGVGGLSVPKALDFPGLEAFQGRVLRTSSWPKEPVDFSGKRVGVIGTGATGIQVIAEVAKQAGHLTVFQRTPQFAAPLGNTPLSAEESQWQAENHTQVRAGSRETFLGCPYPTARPSALADSPEERRKTYDAFYGKGGFRLLVSTYGDLLFNKESNDTIADYLRDRIRQRVKDPKTAELLCPTDHPYGTKRAPFETNYYETYNRDNVELVDVRSAPIERLTERGLKTTAAEYDLDIVILATGFDGFTGALLQLGIVGRDGLTLAKKWADGPHSYMGLQISGFPNLFTLTGPQSAVALFNNALAIEDHVDWVADLLRYMRAKGIGTVEPTTESERVWGALTTDMLNMTLISQIKDTWYMGGNIAGKPKAAYIFPGGAPLYRAISGQVAARGYGGFAMDGVVAPLPPMVRIDPGVGTLFAAMLTPQYKPLEHCTVEESRALVESLVGLQLPGPDMRVEELKDPRVRVFVPDGKRATPRPVILVLHGGGWISGSMDVVDNACRRLAADSDAIAVAVGYRLAPEHPFPAANDDAFAALQWARKHIAEYGGDPEQIAMLGESAGATLVACTAMRARDQGIPLAGQVLIYPTTDPDADTPSRKEFVDGPFLSMDAAKLMWGAYLNGAPVAAANAPARATNLSGLPPSLVLTVELDPLRDEGEDYAKALAKAGVPVEQHRLDGMIHGVFNMSAMISGANEMHDLINRFLAKSLVAAPKAATV